MRPAKGVEVAVVVVGAEFVERRVGVGDEVPDDHRMERPTATIAFFLPRQRVMRR